MRRKLARVFSLSLILVLTLVMSVTAFAGGDTEAKFIISISPPSGGQTGTAFVTIRVEDVNGTGFVQAEARLGDEGGWLNISESLRVNGWAQLEISRSGKVYVSVTDHTGKAHIQSLYVEWYGGAVPAAPEPPAAPPPTMPTEPPAVPADTVTPSPMPTDGSGTVTENSVKVPGEREFYTIQSKKGNDYYLVVDKEKDNENVYLLSEVTEDDLLGLTEPAPVIPELVTEPPTEPETEPPTEALPEPEEEGDAGMIVLIVIVMLVCGGAAYYLKIVRPKRNEIPEDDYAEDDDPDDEMDDEMDEYEYESESDEKKEE